MRLRRSGVWDPQGVFSGCVVLFWAWKNSGNTPQKKHFNKRMGENRKKTLPKSPKIKITKKMNCGKTQTISVVSMNHYKTATQPANFYTPR